jgi:Phytanoyl-CoA dioxygenase (PhyH)
MDYFCIRDLAVGNGQMKNNRNWRFGIVNNLVDFAGNERKWSGINMLRIQPTKPDLATWTADLAENGFLVVPSVLRNDRIDVILREMQPAFAKDADGSTLRSADGSIYGARNLLRLWPAVANVWKAEPLPKLLAAVLGPGFWLVRVLYFDKPPEQSWALPWHQDRAIAVKNNRLSSSQFGKPTFKVGVPHVDAPEWLLENMLTLRMHLDDMTDENGPLKILPRSHRRGADHREPVTILGHRGDVLLMRPLVSHCSNKSHPGTTQHRRILHFEFAGIEKLPDGYAWHDFVHGVDSATR